jgi:2-polyprenyl-3-methyl-5-hydroxy-6-metoxy-1,4-benzoquinol methylase
VADAPEQFTHHLEVSFPTDGDGLDQDEEWLEVEHDGVKSRVLFHDYATIYSIPGLYERLFYDTLHCESPEAVCGLLSDQLEGELGEEGLRVFDVGAGNGMVAEELARRGVDSIVGVDIIEEAKMAAERDRPGLYDDYLVLDLTDIPEDVRAELERRRFNCLITVAALGFGDIPPEAFTAAYDLVEPGGWIAFNIRSRFLAEDDEPTGFSKLIGRMEDEGRLEVLAERKYRHRISVTGEPLYYVAIVARKRG